MYAAPMLDKAQLAMLDRILRDAKARAEASPHAICCSDVPSELDDLRWLLASTVPYESLSDGERQAMQTLNRGRA